MKLVGKDIPATDRWREVGASYASNIDGAYHRQRLGVIASLLPNLAGKRVIDFGCGEGVLAELAVGLGAEVVGMDIDSALLGLARKRVKAIFLRGGVELLREQKRCDVLLAANVLAYMTREEEETFYREAARLGGTLIVTHSNSLFDMFTMNAYTVAFYKEHFGVDPSALLQFHQKPERTSFNIRENPLSYGDKLTRYGFKIERMEYMNYHPKPPLLTKEDPDDMRRERPSTEGVPAWRLAFQCSMFACKALAENRTSNP